MMNLIYYDMKDDNYVILSEKPWNLDLKIRLETKTNKNWFLIRIKDDFNVELLSHIDPIKIFIPHWSHIIEEDIYNRWECIVFHMTDLPFGRGGSPLQNLIVRGYKSTKLSALKVSKGVDTGDVYLKKELNLGGTATEIFERADKIIETMILEILDKNIRPVQQKGKVTSFKRRRPEESDMSKLSEISDVYDNIRMLDADTYPKAYIENKNFRFEFENAEIIDFKTVKANVKIIKK